MELKYKPDGTVDMAGSWAQVEPTYKALKALPATSAMADRFKEEFEKRAAAAPKAPASVAPKVIPAAPTPKSGREAYVADTGGYRAKTLEDIAAEEQKKKATALEEQRSKAVEALKSLNPAASRALAAAPAPRPGIEAPVEGAQVLKSEAGRPDIGSPHATHGYWLDQLKGVDDPQKMADIAYKAISERLAGVNRDSQLAAAQPIIDEWLGLIGDGVSIEDRRKQGRWTPAQKALISMTEQMTKGSEIDRGKALEKAKAESIPKYIPVEPTRTDIVPMATQAVANELAGVPSPGVEMPPIESATAGGVEEAPPVSAEAPIRAPSLEAPIRAPSLSDVVASAKALGDKTGEQPILESKTLREFLDPEMDKKIDGGAGVIAPPEVTGEAPKGIGIREIIEALGSMGVSILDIAQAQQAGLAGVSDPNKLAYRIRQQDALEKARAEAAAKEQEAQREFQRRMEEYVQGQALARQDRELMAQAAKLEDDRELQMALMEYEAELKERYLRTGASLDEAAAAAAYEREVALIRLKASLAGQKSGTAQASLEDYFGSLGDTPELSSGLVK